LAVAFLASCDEQGNFAFPTAARAPAQSTEATGPLVERDVEAPEIFSVTDDGLWDGRPSLGGVWVAHPDVNEPERVIIRNQANGKFVVGALFRRERNIPGPSLQISSDAAASLGILAGAPTQLNVTALTKVTEPAAQDVATPSEPSDTATTETGTIDDAPAVATSTLDPVTAAAGAAIDAATPAPAPAIPAQASNLAKPFIQIGIFSIEANAERAAKQMRGAGLAPTVKQSEINGKTFWRVVVGPAATTAERSKILSAIKAEGYTDAYAVSG
jgi:cell division septation protein DedD